MLENLIGRSPKAWGLGQNVKICFPPARGAYFSIKCGQNAGMEGSASRGRPPGSPGLGFRFLAFFAIFLNFNFILIFINFVSLFSSIFCDVLTSFLDFGRIWGGLGEVFRFFFDVFSMIFRGPFWSIFW